MSEFIRLRANGVDAFPDASTENTYRPNGTSVESALVNLESNVTTLGGVAGEAKTLAEQNSVKIATAEQEISDINSSLETTKIVYSSEEVDTGNTWIDGKKIYRKVVKTSNFAMNATNTELELTEIQNLDSIVCSYGNAHSVGGNNFIPFAMVEPTSTMILSVYSIANKVFLKKYRNTGESNFDYATVIIEYTKK